MHKVFLFPFLLLALLSLSANADESANKSAEDSARNSDWGFTSLITYGPRTIDGTVFENRAGGPTSGGATTESLGLGTEHSFVYALGFRYKKWNFALDYMPTQYSGDGVATIGIDMGNGNIIAIDTPITSTINVDLTLVNVMYDAYVGKYGKFAVGIGAGQTNIDIALVPLIGQPVKFKGTTPFGFLAISYNKRFGKFLLSAAAQGVSLASNDSSMDYTNLNLMGGYAFYTSNKWSSEFVIGYRHVGFVFDYEVNGNVSDTDVTLVGPYLGFIVGF